MEEYLLSEDSRTLYDTFDTNAFQYLNNSSSDNYIFYGGS